MTPQNQQVWLFESMPKIAPFPLFWPLSWYWQHQKAGSPNTASPLPLRCVFFPHPTSSPSINVSCIAHSSFFIPPALSYLSLRLWPQSGVFRGFTQWLDRYKHTEIAEDQHGYTYMYPDMHVVHYCHSNQMPWLLNGPSPTEAHGLRTHKKTR